VPGILRDLAERIYSRRAGCRASDKYKSVAPRIHLPTPDAQKTNLLSLSQKTRHLDRSCSQSHRETSSGETLYFAFAVACPLFVLALAVACSFVCHPAAKRSGGICGCPCRCLFSLPPNKKPRHLDRSCSQSHRETSSDETLYFVFVPSLSFVCPCPCCCLSFCLSSRSEAEGSASPCQPPTRTIPASNNKIRVAQ
jgi:hypothetical protein